ncbi:MAG: hypothetical protein ACOC53_07955 [Candidatus Saliniplasma sp.]
MRYRDIRYEYVPVAMLAALWTGNIIAWTLVFLLYLHIWGVL